MPDSNPFYELIGGYYPGEPIPRKQRPKGPFPQQVNFNVDEMIDAYLREVNKELEKSGVRAQVRKFFIDDLQRSLVAQTRPSGTTYDPFRALELGDEEDVAGVQVKFDINPVNWIRDPKGKLKETATDFINDFANWKDFDSYMELSTLWNPLLNGEDDLSPMIKAAYYDESFVEAVPSAGVKPFQLLNLGDEVKIKKGQKIITPTGTKEISAVTDPFKNTAGEFKKFIRSAKSTGARNRPFRSLINNAYIASATELQQRLNEGKIKDPKQVMAVKSFVHRAKILRLSNAGLGKDDYEDYIFELPSGGTDRWEGLGKGLGNISSDIDAYSLGAKGKKLADVQKTVDTVLNDNFGKIDNALKEADNWFKGLGAKEYNEFLIDTGPLRNLVKEAKSLRGKKILGVDDAKWFKGKIDFIAKKYSSEGPIKAGIDRMHRKFLEQHFLNGEITKVIKDNANIKGSKSLLNVMDEAFRTYKREDFYDLINQLESKGVLGVTTDYFWNLFRERLNGFTPARAMGNALKRRHFFGLMYDKEYGKEIDAEGKYFNQGSKTINSLMSAGPLKRLFENRQTHNIKGVGRFSFVGNPNIKMGLDLYKRTKLTGTAFHLDDNGFIKLLNGEPGGKYFYAEYLNEGWKTENDLVTRASELRNFLKLNNKQLGLKFDTKGKLLPTTENKEILKYLFKGLTDINGSPDVISILQSKAGILDKVSQLANRFQSQFYKWFKFMAPVSYVRNATARVASKAVRKAIAWLAAKLFDITVTAATGIGGLIMPIIDTAVQYIVKKTIDFGSSLLKAIKKGDFNVVGKFFDESVEAFYKVVGMVGIIAIVIFGFTTVIIMGVLSSITPVDPTRDAGAITDSISDYTSYGETALCTHGECPAVSSVDCFTLVGNWPANARGVIENAAQYLVDNGGSFVENLCSDYNDNIEVVWAGSQVACGQASDTYDQIRFGTGQCYTYSSSNQRLFYWLFAHEAAHMYHFANRSTINTQINNAIAQDGDRTLPTYRGEARLECKFNMHRISPDGIMEDFAETMSNLIAYHKGCPETGPYDSWSAFISGLGFQAHYNLARTLYGF